MKYYDETGKNMRPELLDQEARQAAERFVPHTRDSKVDNRNAIKSSQLRRFYNEFKGLERRLAQRPGDPEEAFRSIKPLVKMAKAKVVYAKARNVVPSAFVDWMQGHADAIDTSADFKAFVLHFEAVVGFCYGRNLKD